MANLQFPSNPTSYRRTGWQVVLMFLMGTNYLMDHDPRHIQYGKDQRAERTAEKHRYKSGFVTEIPQDHDEHNKSAQTQPTAHAPPARDNRPHSPCEHPPPVPRDGREAWPYRHGSFYHDARTRRPHDKEPQSRGLNPMSRLQMRDAWTRMRAVSKIPSEYVQKVSGRKKRVAFHREVQWHVFEGDEDSNAGEA